MVKPNLEYIMEECIEAGVKEFIFIISKNKSILKNTFLMISFIKKL